MIKYLREISSGEDDKRQKLVVSGLAFACRNMLKNKQSKALRNNASKNYFSLEIPR